MFLKLMYITNSVDVALIAEKYGVDRIWIDLETLGKQERQGHIDSVKSKHSINDIKKISPKLTKSEMLVRVNPINPCSKEEIDKVIEAGADIIMLPMWKSLDDVKNFLTIVDKRVKTTLLLETKEAVECLDEVLENGGFDKDLTKYGEWKMQEFLSAIVEIDRDYKKCYEKEIGNTLLLDLYNTSTGLIEKIYAKKEIMESILNVLNNVEDFKKNYLDYQTGYEKETNRNYLILRKRMTGKNIKKISFSGQPYLQAGIEKNGQLITLPQLFNMYSALFIMGSLCRYHPEIWGPFVLNDETGERLLFEKFIYYSRRIIPNIVLNIINNDDITYVTQRYSTNETIKHVNEHDVKELVRNEIYDIEEKRRMMK